MNLLSKRNMRAKLTISLLSSFLALPVLAQDLVDEVEEPEIRRYTVEMIIFTYAQDVGTGTEVFLPDEPEPEEELPDEELVVIPEPEPDEEPEPLPDTELVLLVEEDLQMLEHLERLELLDAYEPIMHFGWTQATWPEEQTEPQPLHRFGEPPEGLDGNLTLYLSRYLHLVVDLQLEASREDDADAEYTPSFSDYPAYEDNGLFEEPGAVYHRIQENRIVRNGELRYYDHPKFGVLARVTRVEAEEEEAAADGELLGYPLE